MQTESFSARRDPVIEAQAAAANLGQWTEPNESAIPDSVKDLMPRKTAITGLVFAIPATLFLWMLIGVVFWLVVR